MSLPKAKKLFCFFQTHFLFSLSGSRHEKVHGGFGIFINEKFFFCIFWYNFYLLLKKMDSDLYDEFGNYIGPSLDSDEEEDELEVPQQQDEGGQDEEMEQVKLLLFYYWCLG